MNDLRHDRVSLRLDEFLLGQLSAEERQEVEQHIRECAACQIELHELRLVLEGLGRAPGAVAPPLALRQRVLDAYAREARGTPVSPALSTFAWRPWLAAAAVFVVVLGLAFGVTLERSRRASAELRRVEAEVAELRTKLDEFAGQTDLALSILTAADMKRIELAGSDAWRAAAARAYWSPSRGLLIVADNLPLPPPGRIYQAWIIAGKNPVSAGLIRSQQTRRGMLIAPPPGGLGAGTITVAVTDEPPGGLPAPSGGIRLAGSL